MQGGNSIPTTQCLYGGKCLYIYKCKSGEYINNPYTTTCECIHSDETPENFSNRTTNKELGGLQKPVALPPNHRIDTMTSGIARETVRSTNLIINKHALAEQVHMLLAHKLQYVTIYCV